MHLLQLLGSFTMGAARGSTSVSETFFPSESDEPNCLECKKGINVVSTFPLH